MQAGVLVRVFIASPGDVREEREEACRVIHDWNAAHSLARSVLIEPVRVETHSQAVQGGHPQDLINGQLLDRCDLLVAILWSRLGTPTAKDISGTLQEIHEFAEEKGPEKVLLFFCNRDIPSNTDLKQLEAVREFKARVRAEGLYIDYNSVSDFARSWRQQLDMAMNNLLGSDFLAQVSANPASREVTLKPELCTILLLASMEVRSNIILSRTSGGHQLYAGGRLLSNGNDGRSEARWDGALDQLEDIGFAEDCGHKREVFRLTASGYEAADDLWHVFLLRLISERQGDDDHEYTDIMELTNTLVFDRKMTIEFARERIECLVKSEHLEGVQTERSVSAARLTDAGRKFIREHSWLDFAVPDVAASER